ncbi:class I SAM-dependent methyltransferase [Dactylosporangium cerinum]|uniref:Class I SAM-dependent methyltransferase n=1 Tax=Dactylosporangium cerinum TaxID=1434730 RepID=A0ABV9VSN9_9ACTN
MQQRRLDRLRLVEVPFVPEVRLYLAEDAIVWWARMEAQAGVKRPPPFWSSAWAGGKAIARYVLDHPAAVAGRRVLDLAAGSGLVAIAAGKAGAAVAARGAQVLVGDPGREHLPRGRMQTVATYRLPLVDVFADAQLTQMNVLRLRR